MRLFKVDINQHFAKLVRSDQMSGREILSLSLYQKVLPSRSIYRYLRLKWRRFVKIREDLNVHRVVALLPIIIKERDDYCVYSNISCLTW